MRTFYESVSNTLRTATNVLKMCIDRLTNMVEQKHQYIPLKHCFIDSNFFSKCFRHIKIISVQKHKYNIFYFNVSG